MTKPIQFIGIATLGFVALYQVPAQAQLEFTATDVLTPGNAAIGTGFNPAVPNPLGANAGGLFGGLNIPSIGGGNNPLGGLLGGSSTNPLGGLLGSSGSNPLGGLFGGNSNALGGILTGGKGGPSAGGDLLSLIQGYIGQIGQLVQNPLQFLTIFQDKPPLGESMAPVEQAIQANKGEMGLPDFAKANADALKAETPTAPFMALDPFRLKVGQVSSRSTLSHAQTILGKDGQQLQVKGMQAITKSIQSATGVVQGSTQTAGQVSKFAQQSGQVAQTTAQIGQQSSQTASQTTASAGKIKAAISTQDAVKGLGEQNAQISNIMAGVSNQLGGNSNQLSSVASELAGMSGQQAQAAQQLGEVAAISGDQAVSLRNLQVTGALSNVNLREMNQMMYGKQRRDALERQATAFLPSTGFFRLSK